MSRDSNDVTPPESNKVKAAGAFQIEPSKETEMQALGDPIQIVMVWMRVVYLQIPPDGQLMILTMV